MRFPFQVVSTSQWLVMGLVAASAAACGEGMKDPHAAAAAGQLQRVSHLLGDAASVATDPGCGDIATEAGGLLSAIGDIIQKHQNGGDISADLKAIEQDASKLASDIQACQSSTGGGAGIPAQAQRQQQAQGPVR